MNRFELNEPRNSNAGLETKSHETTDEFHQLDKTKFEIVRLEAFTFRRFNMTTHLQNIFLFGRLAIASNAISLVYFDRCDRDINFQLTFMKAFLKRLL